MGPGNNKTLAGTDTVPASSPTASVDSQTAGKLFARLEILNIVNMAQAEDKSALLDYIESLNKQFNIQKIDRSFFEKNDTPLETVIDLLKGILQTVETKNGKTNQSTPLFPYLVLPSRQINMGPGAVTPITPIDKTLGATAGYKIDPTFVKTLQDKIDSISATGATASRQTINEITKMLEPYAPLLQGAKDYTGKTFSQAKPILNGIVEQLKKLIKDKSIALDQPATRTATPGSLAASPLEPAVANTSQEEAEITKELTKAQAEMQEAAENKAVMEELTRALSNDTLTDDDLTTADLSEEVKALDDNSLEQIMLGMGIMQGAITAGLANQALKEGLAANFVGKVPNPSEVLQKLLLKAVEGDLDELFSGPRASTVKSAVNTIKQTVDAGALKAVEAVETIAKNLKTLEGHAKVLLTDVELALLDAQLGTLKGRAKQAATPLSKPLPIKLQRSMSDIVEMQKRFTSSMATPTQANAVKQAVNKLPRVTREAFRRVGQPALKAAQKMTQLLNKLPVK